MKVYISGPMTGMPELNASAFHAAADQWRKTGADVVVPAELDHEPSAEWVVYMRTDIKALVDCDAIFMLRGWASSAGALAEKFVAETLKMKVFLQSENGNGTLPTRPLPETDIVAVKPGPTPIRITNKFNLPRPLVEAVKNDKYSPGQSDYTTTQLAGTPARQLVLKRKHWNELSEDVADLIYSLSGKSKHVVLERAAEFCKEYHYLAEERFYIKRCGKTIGGQIDLYDENTKTLWDWKETSVYVSYHSVKPEWIAQGNINKLLLEENGYPVENMVNIALYRDWKKSQVGTTEKYPEHQVEQFPIEAWPIEQTEDFIAARIADFENAKKELPECNDEERWKSPDVYALTKKGNKRATKLFNTEAEARSHIEIFDIKNHEILFRPGVNKRCESYCVVAPFCEQFQKIKEKENAANGDSKAA